MAVHESQYPGDLQALANEIRALRRELDTLRDRPLRIPVLGADPPTGDPTNLWAFPDGRIRYRRPDGTISNFIPDAAGSTTSGTAKPAVVQPKSYVTEYAAAWSQTYKGDGTQRTDDATMMHYGRLDATNGRQKVLIGFDATAIASALTGASVKGVELYLSNQVAHYGTVLIRFSAHTNTTKPATYGGQYRYDVSLREFAAPDARWVSLSTAYGDWLKAGTIKGVGIVQASDSPAEYGAALGVGSGDPPRLRITYVK